MNDLVERVKQERRVRGWSMRAAAGHGGISNQAWSIFEKTGVVTNGVQRAVMQAFSWPENWQLDPPESPVRVPGETAELHTEIRELRDQLAAALEVMADLTAELRRQGDVEPRRRSTTPPRRRAASQ